uniref:membrane protein insertase YidC n=1 Tax=Aquisalimonas sp. TaxID=1872621 RepID=UPI0025BFFD90
METQRILQFFALALVLLLIWTAWQDDYGVGAPEEPVAEEERIDDPGDVDDVPAPPEPGDQPEPEEDDVAEPAPQIDDAAAPATAAGDRLERGNTVRVRTDKLDVEISTRGGDIRQVDLLRHYRTLEGQEPFRLKSDVLQELFIAQSGLVPRQGEGPGPQSEFRVDQHEYVLGDDEDTIEVPLVWENDDGIKVTKRYIFERDSYVIKMEHEVENASDADWDAYQYAQLRSGDIDDGTSWFIYTYTGGVVHGEENRYDKISFSDMRSDDLSEDLTNGWAAIIQHYFVGAWIPPRDETHRYYTRSLDNNQYLLGISSPRQNIAAGSSGTFEHQLWVGPKEQERLAQVAEGLDLTVDYGWLTIISKPLFIALSWIHGVVGNWGW